MNGSFSLTSRHGLHFREEGDGTFRCEEIATLGDRLAASTIEAAIETVIAGVCECDVSCERTFTDPVQKRTARRYTEEMIEMVRAHVSACTKTPFEALLYWCCEWWNDVNGFDHLHFRRTQQLKIFTDTVLAEIIGAVREEEGVEKAELYIENGRFACQIGSEAPGPGRIVFDGTGRFWHLPLMSKYVYGQVQRNGLPLVRGAGGGPSRGRCFFDGVRFMCLDGFGTCRHDAWLHRNGYVLHADNGYTICNGKVYQLGYAAAEQALIDGDGRLMLNEEPVTALLGEFKPSLMRWYNERPRVESSEFVPCA